MQLQLKRAARLGIALVAFFCSTAWAQPGPTLVVSPMQLEAYQPFTATIGICENDGTLETNVGIVGVHVEAGTVTLDHLANMTIFLACGYRFKTATVSGLPAGTYAIKARNLYPGDHSPVLLGEFTVDPAPTAQPVYAFLHGGINHYFITASQTQRDFLLQNNLGWTIVDEGFKAWPASGPAPAAAKPVCRLYSPLVNTHFFSADAAVCDFLKQQTGTWVDEGIAFRALVPTAGMCPSGTLPVWRLYNNRFAQLDSNHRYVTSQDTYRHMIANGWIGEGVRFCSPE